MRQIINISLPQQMAKELRINVKKEGFATVSEFFRHLLREWQINKLLREVKKGRQEIKAGKGIKLKSLKDLL
ncbi:MAG: ribbon-helix-helix domain-containing protein [Candidatus Komeilibacteria bacterium]|nr:ribbon-helix-helix domain-containing protein [Candidatus Komeilibacteria bacterium]